MNHFERAAVALIVHAFSDLIGPSGSKSLSSSGRYVQTLTGSGNVRRFFDIREISWNQIDFKGQTADGDYKVWNENYITKSKATIYTEQRRSEIILLENLSETETKINIRGYWARAWRDGWGIVKIEDNEMSGQVYRYQIKN